LLQAHRGPQVTSPYGISSALSPWWVYAVLTSGKVRPRFCPWHRIVGQATMPAGTPPAGNRLQRRFLLGLAPFFQGGRCTLQHCLSWWSTTLSHNLFRRPVRPACGRIPWLPSLSRWHATCSSCHPASSSAQASDASGSAVAALSAAPMSSTQVVSSVGHGSGSQQQLLQRRSRRVSSCL
jgi:hypothetical protein